MNYKLIYDKLIERGKLRNLGTTYKERHHVIPLCLGGTDDLFNLVELTAEEHFIAHQLLVKMYPTNMELLSALSRMCSGSYKNKRNNKWYGWIRNKFSEANSGENNHSAKFTHDQVLDIYYSNLTIGELAFQYNVARYNIITIKRKIHYRNITADINELPGYNPNDLRIPIPIDLIPEIFYDTGDYGYFWEKYRATEKVVRGIKGKKSFKKITHKLGTPGQVRRYGMTQDEVETIYSAKGTNSAIAARFGIHYNTVRNIKGKNSRAFDMWEEF